VYRYFYIKLTLSSLPATLIVVFLTLSAAPGSAATIGGVYYLSSPNQSSIPDWVLNNPYVDGIAYRATWSELEPRDSGFRFSELDNVLAQARSSGKRVSLIVQAGHTTPAWVYEHGAAAYNFIWDQNYGAALCSDAKIPIPWDPIFQANWASFLATLGRRYDNNSTLAFIYLTGINGSGAEMSLPANNGKNPIYDANGTVLCTSYNDTSRWRAIGYTRLRVEVAWIQIANYYAASFPRKRWIAPLVPGLFPPLDDWGNLLPGATKRSVDKQLHKDVLSIGVTSYSAHFGARNAGLTNKYIMDDIVDVSAYVPTGQQTPSPLGEKLPRAINLAIENNAVFLELYPDDIANPSLAAIIRYAHAMLYWKD